MAKRGPKKPLPHAFKKGEPRPPNAGRKKGTPNKITTDMREAILEAFNRLGGPHYLVTRGKRDFRTMGGLLRAIIPQKTITGPDPEEVGRTIRQQTSAMDDLTGGDEKEKEK